MNSAPQLRSSRALSSLTCALPALWLALPSTTSAQQSCDLPPESGKFIPAPEGVFGSYKRIVSGDVSGDWDEEVTTIKGNSVIVYHGPSMYNKSKVIGLGAIDLCFAADAGSGTAGILYTTSGDLFRVTFDTSLHDYNAPFSVSSAPLLQNAPIVRSSTGVAGGTSGKGLFGVAANLRTVFRAPLQSGGFPNAFSMFTQSYDVLDIVPLNWDSDSDMELAILDTHGVQVREQDGTSRLNRTGQNAGDAIAVVHMDGFTDSLAWITRLSGWSKLLFFNQNFTTQGPQPITTGTFHSMANADIDSDGDDDLVLASSASNALLVLTNNTPPPVPPPTPPTPPSTWFSVSTPSIDMSMLCDGSVSSGKVLCANLYNQWVDSNWEDDDAVTPPRPVPAFALVLPNVAGVDGLRILPQQGEGQQQSIADFASVWYEGARWLNETLCDTPLDPVEDEEIYWSNWKLTLGSGWGLTNATHMEMVVRKCPEDSTVPDEQLHHGSHLILPAEVPAAIPNFELNFHGAENGSDEDLAFDYRYYVELRPIKMSGPTVLRVWRWSIMGLSPTCDGTIALRGLPGAGGPLFGINFTHCCGTPESDCSTTYSPGAVVVPSAIPLSEIPSGPGYPGDPPPPEQ